MPSSNLANGLPQASGEASEETSGEASPERLVGRFYEFFILSSKRGEGSGYKI